MDRRPRTRLCVRCGLRPRSGATFLCGGCLADPLARQEAAAILRLVGDETAKRRAAIERYHWFGGWGRDD